MDFHNSIMRKYKPLFEGNDFVGKKLLLKNTEQAPNMGSRFGQDVEPSGFFHYYIMRNTINIC